MSLIRSGLQYEYTNAGASTIKAGTGVAFGAAGFGVAEVDIPAGATGVLAASGTWSLPCSSLSANAGALAYWDASNGKVVASGASLVAIGVFGKAVVSADTEAVVCVFPTGVKSAAG